MPRTPAAGADSQRGAASVTSPERGDDTYVSPDLQARTFLWRNQSQGTPIHHGLLKILRRKADCSHLVAHPVGETNHVDGASWYGCNNASLLRNTDYGPGFKTGRSVQLVARCGLSHVQLLANLTRQRWIVILEVGLNEEHAVRTPTTSSG